MHSPFYHPQDDSIWDPIQSQMSAVHSIIFLSVIQQSKLGLGFHMAQVSRSHTIRHTHTHTVRLLCTSDKTVAEAATCTMHNKHNRRTSMNSTGFEPAIPAVKRLNTYALDRTAIWIGPQSRTISEINLYIMHSLALTSSSSLRSLIFD